jgi:hypothetical protein
MGCVILLYYGDEASVRFCSRKATATAILSFCGTARVITVARCGVAKKGAGGDAIQTGQHFSLSLKAGWEGREKGRWGPRWRVGFALPTVPVMPNQGGNLGCPPGLVTCMGLA